MRNSYEQSANSAPRRKQLNPRFDKMLAAYTTAAGATVGLALLAAAQPAEAKIVYTKTNLTITSSYLLDLNHDGVPDFDIDFCSCRPHGAGLWVQVSNQSYVHAPRNAVREQTTFPGDAAALRNGVTIGPKQAFISPQYGYGAAMASAGSYGAPYSGGPWLNVTKRYLGLKFLIHGEVHYGWARLSVTDQIFKIVLTGYAYETTPNKSLRAGQTSETAANESDDTVSLTKPTTGRLSLGLLARGAEAMEFWRKKEPLVSRIDQSPTFTWTERLPPPVPPRDILVI